MDTIKKISEAKNIKDYLHLYKDVIVQVKRANDKDYHVGRVCEITSKSNHGDWVVVWFDDVITVTSMTWATSSSNAHSFFFNHDHIKPILRQLSDMTEEELKGYEQIYKDHIPTYGGDQFLAAKLTKYLLSLNIDLFGLIESGLAIDKTTLK